MHVVEEGEKCSCMPIVIITLFMEKCVKEHSIREVIKDDGSHIYLIPDVRVVRTRTAVFLSWIHMYWQDMHQDLW